MNRTATLCWTVRSNIPIVRALVPTALKPKKYIDWLFWLIALLLLSLSVGLGRSLQVRPQLTRNPGFTHQSSLSTAIFPNLNSWKGSIMSAQEKIRVRAPELTGGRGWLNTDKPLTLAALKGKVVLLDFWTYGCINCIHIIPDLKRLEHKYPNQLVVIGVHSAKFENEKDTENIRRIILRYELEHPVYNDADYKVWQSYGVRAWPTQVLIDPAGYVIGAVSGEGNYDLIDKVVAKAVAEFRKR